MPYPIAMIPFTNMAPYRAAGTPKGCVFHEMPPRASIASLLAGDTLAACAPVGALPVLRSEVDFLGSYGIAATDKTMSVYCFSHRPFAELDQTTTLCLTGLSASSVRLLFLLLGYQQGFTNLPYLANDRVRADAELLIGDEAISAAGENNWRYQTDLATVWQERKKLPFVFARWVIRKDAPSAARDAMLAWLNDYSEREVVCTEFAIRELAASTKNLGDANFWRDYFFTVRRVLTETDLRGQSCFLAEISRYACEPLFKNSPVGDDSRKTS